MNGFLDNLLHALAGQARRLVRRPSLAIAVILPLPLGIAANTATLSLLYGYLLAPLPYPRAGRLVEVYVPSRAFPAGTFGPGYGTYFGLRTGANGMTAAGMTLSASGASRK
jgi:hypothetical protein